MLSFFLINQRKEYDLSKPDEFLYLNQPICYKTGPFAIQLTGFLQSSVSQKSYKFLAHLGRYDLVREVIFLVIHKNIPKFLLDAEWIDAGKTYFLFGKFDLKSKVAITLHG